MEWIQFELLWVEVVNDFSDGKLQRVTLRCMVGLLRQWLFDIYRLSVALSLLTVESEAIIGRVFLILNTYIVPGNASTNLWPRTLNGILTCMQRCLRGSIPGGFFC